MLIGTMSQNPALANEFTENFNYPDRQWDRVSTAEAHPCLDRRGCRRLRSPCGPLREAIDALPDDC